MYTKIILVIYSAFVTMAEINDENLSDDKFALNLTPTTLSAQNWYDCFHCESGSNLKQLSSINGIKEQTSCNSIQFELQSLEMNVSYLNRPDIIRADNVKSYSINLNGNSIIWQTGRIQEGKCAGGLFEIIKFFVVTDHNGCSTDTGLERITSVRSSFTIKNGNCAAKCTGGSAITFNPAIRNYQ